MLLAVRVARLKANTEKSVCGHLISSLRNAEQNDGVKVTNRQCCSIWGLTVESQNCFHVEVETRLCETRDFYGTSDEGLCP